MRLARFALAAALLLAPVAANAAAWPTYQDNTGRYQPAQGVSEPPLAPIVDTAAVASKVIKAVPASLWGVSVANTSGSAVWVLILDATSAPVDGAVTPKQWLQLAANTSGVLTTIRPTIYLVGITAVCSSTGPFTKTAVTSCAFSAQAQ